MKKQKFKTKLVNFKVSETEFTTAVELSKRYAKGNLSEWLRIRATTDIDHEVYDDEELNDKEG